MPSSPGRRVQYSGRGAARAEQTSDGASGRAETRITLDLLARERAGELPVVLRVVLADPAHQRATE